LLGVACQKGKMTKPVRNNRLYRFIQYVEADRKQNP
jgi:hypothetical protein